MRESKLWREAVQEGELTAKRADILEAVEARFGAAAVAELSPAVNGLEDLEQTARLFRLALRCRNVAEIRAALAAEQRA